MIDTDLTAFSADLQEEITPFGIAEDERVRHRFTENGDKIVNTVTVFGKTFAFGTLVSPVDETDRKRLIKRYAKLSIYKALSKTTGKTLPWGALTGIRPTALAYAETRRTGDYVDLFRNVMQVSEEKISLTQAVINAQKGVYEDAYGKRDLFVFIPFCPTRCEYCSFISRDMRGAEELADVYAEKLLYDIEKGLELCPSPHSIYIGGGTPVALKNDALIRVLDKICTAYNGGEFTVEAGRPDAITAENVRILKDHGVTRVCVNPQTFNDETLQRIGRKHTAEDVLRAYDLVKGKFAVNMDLIAGLPGENAEIFRATLEKTISLDPENVTVHTLCVKKGSYLADKVKTAGAGDAEECVEYARERLAQAGYAPYYLYRQKYSAGNLENVGYCKPNTQCAFNVGTMEDISDVVACGANAISKRIIFGGGRIERYACPKDVKTYINKLDEIVSRRAELFLNE